MGITHMSVHSTVSPDLPLLADIDATVITGTSTPDPAPRQYVRLIPETYTSRRVYAQSGIPVEDDLSLRHRRQSEGRLPHVGALAPPQDLADITITPINSIEDFPRLAQAPTFSLNQRYRRFRITIEPGPTSLAPSPFVYLFNVIVAMEWRPSQAMLLPIMRGLRAASDFLFDATNGCMAFGQVVFAGPELMGQADIQILASNRFHPRSMVNGLNDERKYSPIRLGRGSWHKNNRVLLPWDESIAYRAITHEWAHYALSLRDEYIDEMRRVVRRGTRLLADAQGNAVLVVPKVRLPLESIMATLDASELVPLQRQSHLSEEIQSRLLNEIEQWYTGASEQITQPLSGPYRFPASLPQFYTVDGFQINDQMAEETWINVDNLALDHSWLYSFDWHAAQTLRLTAQGTLDGRSQSFQIASGGPLIQGDGFNFLGAQPGATVLAVGTDSTGLVIQQAQIVPDEETLSWINCTPASPPVVAALPDPDNF
ncbi:MAG: hypothetical protein HGA19_14450, partial [Oscillochloris sp.]|nr:hypothetical protein [Oscillochloris sp.]